MAAIPNTFQQTGVSAPYDELDNYAVIDEKYGRIFFKGYETIQERNSDTRDRRKSNMHCYVSAEGKYYKLNGNPATELTSNSDWVESDLGGAKVFSLSQSSFDLVVQNSGIVFGATYYITDSNKIHYGISGNNYRTIYGQESQNSNFEIPDYLDTENIDITTDTYDGLRIWQNRIFKATANIIGNGGDTPLTNNNWVEISASQGDWGAIWSSGIYKNLTVVKSGDYYYQLSVSSTVFLSQDFQSELSDGKWIFLGPGIFINSVDNSGDTFTYGPFFTIQLTGNIETNEFGVVNVPKSIKLVTKSELSNLIADNSISVGQHYLITDATSSLDKKIEVWGLPDNEISYICFLHDNSNSGVGIYTNDIYYPISGGGGTNLPSINSNSLKFLQINEDFSNLVWSDADYVNWFIQDGINGGTDDLVNNIGYGKEIQFGIAALNGGYAETFVIAERNPQKNPDNTLILDGNGNQIYQEIVYVTEPDALLELTPGVLSGRFSVRSETNPAIRIFRAFSTGLQIIVQEITDERKAIEISLEEAKTLADNGDWKTGQRYLLISSSDSMVKYEFRSQSNSFPSQSRFFSVIKNNLNNASSEYGYLKIGYSSQEEYYSADSVKFLNEDGSISSVSEPLDLMGLERNQNVLKIQGTLFRNRNWILDKISSYDGSVPNSGLALTDYFIQDAIGGTQSILVSAIGPTIILNKAYNHSTGQYGTYSIVSDTFFPHSHTISEIPNLQSSLNGKVNTSSVGAANGVAALDPNSFLPRAQAARDSLVRQLNLDFSTTSLTQTIPLRNSSTTVTALSQIGLTGNITFQLLSYPSEASVGASVIWDGASVNAATAITSINSRLSSVSPAANIRMRVATTGISGTVGTLFLDHIPNS